MVLHEDFTYTRSLCIRYYYFMIPVFSGYILQTIQCLIIWFIAKPLQKKTEGMYRPSPTEKIKLNEKHCEKISETIHETCISEGYGDLSRDLINLIISFLDDPKDKDSHFWLLFSLSLSLCVRICVCVDRTIHTRSHMWTVQCEDRTYIHFQLAVRKAHKNHGPLSLYTPHFLRVDRTRKATLCTVHSPPSTKHYKMAQTTSLTKNP